MIASRWRDLRSRLHAQLRPVDVVASLLLFACAFPGSMVGLPGSDLRVPWWPGVLLAGISCTALLWHRGHPRVTVAVTTACAVAMAALGYLLTVLLLGPLMAALYSLAVRVDRRSTRLYALSAATLLVVGTDLLLDPSDHSLDAKAVSTVTILLLRGVGPAAWLLLPTVLGSTVRLRRAYLEEVKARAEHAERTREEEARHRVAAERMRIARELHDVVAHHLVLANMQAGTAAHLVRTHPDQVQEILADLSGTTSAALRELKATVGLLRQADDPAAPTEPVPGLARLSDLTGSFEPAGLKVTVSTEGEPRSLSPGVDLTAFRIVQEALTNVTKHADTSTAWVNLAYAQDRLTVTVTDDGGGPTPSGPTPSRPAPSGPAPSVAPNTGFGLVGMRERALSVGGRLRTGARPEGGFQVTAELPLHPASLEEDRIR
ncbi:sensor histidine kinase [Actinoallomurus sp. CA-150999]|uniref:sensor histidine kinase n=1 Tax=Actinoallomurus sp. CA-150999 TaxID=3239887 RepID=UPI003D8FE07D